METIKKHKFIAAFLTLAVLGLIVGLLLQTGESNDKPKTQRKTTEVVSPPVVENKEDPHEGFIRVPDLADKTRLEAVNILKEKGLAIEIVEISLPTKAGKVIKQMPVAGVDVKPKTKVTLFVAKSAVSNANSLTMPDLVGKTEAQARKELIALGVKVNASYIFDPKKKTGEVVAQNPMKGQMLAKGLQVQLIVNKDLMNTPVQMVPTVVGKTLVQAKAILTKAGYKVQVNYTPQTIDNLKPGYVVSQNPPKGLALPKGQKVYLMVYRMIQSAPVPKK